MTDNTEALPPLPERDTTKPAEQQGLFRKFIVTRTDGSSGPGGKHEHCEHFVLDVNHDPHAAAALAAYADAVERTHPELAADMRQRYALAQRQQVPEGWQPIKNAPRDGTNLLLRFGLDCVSQGKFVPGLPHPWKFLDTNDGITWLVNHAVDGPGGPSHWMRLPSAALTAAPSAQRQQAAPMSEDEVRRLWDKACRTVTVQGGGNDVLVFAEYLQRALAAAPSAQAEPQEPLDIAAIRAACRAEALEEAAQAAEEIEDQAWALWRTVADPHDQGRSLGAASVAQAIREMK